jgi:hypothetical protein
LSTPASGTNLTGFAAFQLIVRRNIFDPTRRPYVNNYQAPITRTRPSVPQIFSFRGASEKIGMGYTAFFSGFGIPPSQEVSVNDVINGYKVVKITLHSVTLADTKTTNMITLNEQGGMSRVDGGPWKWTVVPTVYTAAYIPPAEAQPEFSQPQTFEPPQPFNGRNFTFTQPDDGSGVVDFTGGQGGGRRGRNRGGNGNNNFGGAAGGNFGAGGFGGDATPAAPAAPADPAVLQRLAARRAAEEAQSK